MKGICTNCKKEVSDDDMILRKDLGWGIGLNVFCTGCNRKLFR